MAKGFVGFYLDVGLVDEMRRRARSSGAPLSALAGLLLRYGLDRVNDEALKKWAATRGSERGRLGGGLRASEQAALRGIAEIRAEELKRAARESAVSGMPEPAAWQFSASEIGDRGGLLRKEAYLALNSLKARGLVDGVVWEHEGEDRWGRPRKSFWWRPEDKAEGEILRAAHEAAVKAKGGI